MMSQPGSRPSSTYLAKCRSMRSRRSASKPTSSASTSTFRSAIGPPWCVSDETLWEARRMALERWLFTRRIPAPMFNGLVRGRRGLRAMRARLGPVNGEVIDRTLAIVEIRAVGLAAELDLAEHVARRGLTSQELADVAEVDSDALDRLLHLLASTGWFHQRRDGTWTNTRLSKSLRAQHPLSMRDWARFFGGGELFRIFAGADVSRRTGDSATTAVMGRPFFEWTADDREAGARFDGAMRDASRFLGEALTATVPVPDGATICDVGGGTGRLVAALLASHPDRRGIL